MRDWTWFDLRLYQRIQTFHFGIAHQWGYHFFVGPRWVLSITGNAAVNQPEECHLQISTMTIGSDCYLLGISVDHKGNFWNTNKNGQGVCGMYVEDICKHEWVIIWILLCSSSLWCCLVAFAAFDGINNWMAHCGVSTSLAMVGIYVHLVEPRKDASNWQYPEIENIHCFELCTPKL